MSLFSLMTKFGAEWSEFDKGVAHCEMAAKKFGRTVAKDIGSIGAGYLTVNYALGLMSDSFERAGNIADLSERLGIDIKLLQELQYAAKQTGTDIEVFAQSIKKINLARAEALSDPNGEKANIFKRYSISIDELKTKSGEDLFRKIGNAVKEVQNPQNELNFAVELLGKTAAEKVFPAMRAGLEDVAKAAKEAGEVLDKDVVKRLDDVGDKFESIKRKTGNSFATIVVESTGWLSKAFLNLAKGFAGFAGPINQADILVKEQESKQPSKPKPKETFEAAPKAAKQATQKESPTEWAYKPMTGDSLREIGGFTSAAQNAQIANLEKIKDAVERSASANEKAVEIAESDGSGL